MRDWYNAIGSVSSRSNNCSAPAECSVCMCVIIRYNAIGSVSNRSNNCPEDAEGSVCMYVCYHQVDAEGSVCMYVYPYKACVYIGVYVGVSI